MKFKKYSSIENSYRKKYIEILREHGFADIPYVVTEKLHGANFSFWTDGIEVRSAQRSQFTDGNFYNCQEVIDRYSEQVMELKNKEYPEANEIAVYGELFGPKIQKGIYYGTEKDFMAFELRIMADDEHDFIVPQIQAGMLFKKYKINHVPFITVCASLDEALEVSNEFTSHAYKNAYGYDAENDVCEFTAGENLAEGVVIIPADGALYTGNGSRVMLKNKTEKFAEVIKSKKVRKEKVDNPFNDLAATYVNENRMNAVVSKFGEVTQKDFGRIIGLMNIDILEDLVKDEEIPEDWKKQDEYKLLGKAVSSNVSKFMKQNLLPEI